MEAHRRPQGRSAWIRGPPRACPLEAGDMTYKSEATLDQFRGSGICEWCRQPVSRREAAHVFSRGTGQLDIRIALAGLCGAFSGGQNCHAKSHGEGYPGQDDLLLMVAKRECVRQDDIRAVVYLLRRLNQDGRRTRQNRPLAEELAELCGPARELFAVVFREMGKGHLLEAA